MKEQSTRTVNRTTQVTDPQASTATHWHALIFIRSLVRERMKHVWSDKVTQRETDRRGAPREPRKKSQWTWAEVLAEELCLCISVDGGCFWIIRLSINFIQELIHTLDAHYSAKYSWVFDSKKSMKTIRNMNTPKFLKRSLLPAKLGQNVKSRVHSLCLGTNVSFS